MDTLGVCGAPSIAADNGVVMVKEPRLQRVSETWTPCRRSESDVSECPRRRTERKTDSDRSRCSVFPADVTFRVGSPDALIGQGLLHLFPRHFLNLADRKGLLSFESDDPPGWLAT